MNDLFSISIIQSIQNWRTPLLDKFFIFCNFFDTATFSIFLIVIVGLFINRKLGFKLALFLSLNFLVNKFLKQLFAMPRPLDIDPSLGLMTLTTPGFPSGAAQSSLLLCGILIKEWSSPLKWIIGPLYLLTISFSRLYLGVHFPGDILGGWAAGLVLLCLYLSISNWKKGVVLMTTLAAASVFASDPAQGLLYSHEKIEAKIPDKQLTPRSFVIQSGGLRYSEWTENEHRQSYKVMTAASSFLSNAPFLVYGEIHSASPSPFRWHFVPFQKQSNIVFRYWQQMQVAWRVIFSDGIPLKGNEKEFRTNQWDGAFDQVKDVNPEVSLKAKSDDPFCNEEIIKNQLVKDGETVRVLYDYRPIGDSHFLIVPKKHRRDFRQLTEEEYVEAAKLSQFVINRLREKQPAANIYFMHKAQPDAGQSVLHWHWHVIITDSPKADFWSKATFLWRMTFGANSLPQKELTERVDHYKEMLN